MYTPDGFMGVVNTPEQRARVSAGTNPMSLDGISAAERAAAAEGVVAYMGRYEVKGDVVHHTIYAALNPNLVGTTQVRRATLGGRRPHAFDIAGRPGKVFSHPLAARRQGVTVGLASTKQI